jgi:dihydrofolate synthase / folylpolyglutamate synthase
VLDLGARGAIEPKVLHLGGRVELVLDVAHNPDAVQVLARWLSANPVPGPTVAALGMRADKDVEGVARALEGAVDAWIALDIASEGGMDAAAMRQRLGAVTAAPVTIGQAPAAEAEAQRKRLPTGARLVVLGSFLTVGAVLRSHEAARQTVTD